MSAEHSDRPDIFLIVLDTLRADRLSCYGGARNTSPNLDVFAKQSTFFERAIAPAQWTVPSHASIFTGEYPTTHMAVQPYDALDSQYPTVAERLHGNGYHTVGFSNNAMVGVLDNDLTRGFERYFNYGASVHAAPAFASSLPAPLAKLWEHTVGAAARFVRPIENRVTCSPRLIRLGMNRWLHPFWALIPSPKGNTWRSMQHVRAYLRSQRAAARRRPLFVFINWMETHVPYNPPPRFLDQLAPYLRRDRAARDFVRYFSKAAYEWTTPLAKPLTELEWRVIHDLYDAEIAYQDHLLGRFLRYLDGVYRAEEFMVIVTSDHGEGLGEHAFMGHSMAVYQEQAHVPLLIRYPPQYPPGHRVEPPISMRRLHHTIQEAAGIPHVAGGSPRTGENGSLSLARTVEGNDPEGETAFVEAYPQNPLLEVMDDVSPELVARYRCHEIRRAVCRGGSKLIRVGSMPDELFNTGSDPSEEHSRLSQERDLTDELNQLIEEFVPWAESRRAGNGEPSRTVEMDDETARRLKGLGYLG